LRTDVRELLDFSGRVLDLGVRHRKLQLLHARLDGVPACKPVSDGKKSIKTPKRHGTRSEKENTPNGHVSREPKVLWLEDFICARVVKDGFGVDARFVRESTVATVQSYYQ
jgi:hypothetical protein